MLLILSILLFIAWLLVFLIFDVVAWPVHVLVVLAAAVLLLHLARSTRGGNPRNKR